MDARSEIILKFYQFLTGFILSRIGFENYINIRCIRVIRVRFIHHESDGLNG